MSFQTDWYSPPGATILDALNARGVEIDDFAVELGYSRSKVDRLIAGDLAIDHDMAIALADVVGASPKFWLQRQADFEIDRRVIPTHVVEKLRPWLQSLPTGDMAKFGWIPSTKSIQDKALNCLQFFGVNSAEQWEARYSKELAAVAFRASASLEADVPATVAWLRKGEIEASGVKAAVWDKAKFLNSLEDIRLLTRTKDPKVFLPQLKNIAASCGVTVVVARAPKGCRSSGATKFVSPTQALMMLSFRHRSDDHFWFTFFHEAAHLILHDTSRLFIEGDDEKMGEEELEANQFAQEFLIPSKHHDELVRIRRDFRAIVKFARKIGISHGIVVGQLQHLKLIDKSWLNRLKQRYEWKDIEAAANL